MIEVKPNADKTLDISFEGSGNEILFELANIVAYTIYSMCKDASDMIIPLSLMDDVDDMARECLIELWGGVE